MKQSKGAYKQYIIKEYIKEPFQRFKKKPNQKNFLPLITTYSFLCQFDFGSDNIKLKSIENYINK